MDNFPKFPAVFIVWMIFCAVVGVSTLAGVFYLANKAIEAFS